MNKSWRSAWCKKAELSDHTDSDTTKEAPPWRLCTTSRPLPLTKSIVSYEAVGDRMKISDADTDADGQSTHMEWIGKFDAKDYQVRGDASADS